MQCVPLIQCVHVGSYVKVGGRDICRKSNIGHLWRVFSHIAHQCMECSLVHKTITYLIHCPVLVSNTLTSPSEHPVTINPSYRTRNHYIYSFGVESIDMNINMSSTHLQCVTLWVYLRAAVESLCSVDLSFWVSEYLGILSLENWCLLVV